MPGLLRGVARTAVVAGTATAVSGRVQRHQSEKFAERDAQIYAQRQQAYDQQYDQQVTAAPPATAGSDVVEQLKGLAELRDRGVLNDAEFEAQKARILAG
jgi:hypothetical protein